jgi:hypothetical protein
VDTFRYLELPSGEEVTFAELEKREDKPKRYYRDDPQRALNDFPGARVFKSENVTGGKPGGLPRSRIANTNVVWL